jgi:hypothetical protein
MERLPPSVTALTHCDAADDPGGDGHFVSRKPGVSHKMFSELRGGVRNLTIQNGRPTKTILVEIGELEYTTDLRRCSLLLAGN